MSSPDFNGRLAILERTECLQLLERQGLGRVGGQVQGRPVIFPVNYALFDNTIWFRMRRDGDLDRATRDTDVAFEIDGVDRTYHEGWSVLVTGRCTHVSNPVQLDQLRSVPLLPWAGERRNLVARISLESVSGRRLHHNGLNPPRA
jgi:nitroimidazol reductase NimA-like FMN-containing flavoprotein (pyridoxamine 5'-phosphate oxidase superfamily)